MENSKELLQEITAIRVYVDKDNYDPFGKHLNTLYFAKDEGKMYFNGDIYGVNPTKIEWFTINIDSDTEMFSNKDIRLEGEEYYETVNKIIDKYYANEPVYFKLYNANSYNYTAVKLIPNMENYYTSFNGVVIGNNGNVMYFKLMVSTTYKFIDDEYHYIGIITIQSFRIITNDVLYKSNIQKISEEEYNALETKDPNTLYCIPEEG